MPLSNTSVVDGATGGISQAELGELATFAMPDASVAGVTAVVDAMGALVSPASQATLAALLAKVIAAPSTEAKQDAIVALLTTLNTYVDGLEGKDYATQTTLAAVLAKLSSDPATQTTLAAVLVKLNASLAVTGAFYQATQPVSAVSLPLPAGAAQDGTDITTPTAMPAGGVGTRGWLSAIWTKLNGTIGVAGTFWQATQPVSGTFWQATQPVSNASLPLPTGASTAAKQPVLGTAGAASADVLSVQGIAGGVAQPVSGTVTATVGVKATLWQNAPVSRGTVLTTELNSLANNAYSAVGTAIDNTSNGDQYGALDIVLASLNPTSGASLSLYLVQSLDGTNYEDAPSSTNPGSHTLVATVLVGTGAATKRVMSPWFYVPPGKFRFVLLNSAGVALAASANTVTLFTDNDETQ